MGIEGKKKDVFKEALRASAAVLEDGLLNIHCAMQILSSTPTAVIGLEFETVASISLIGKFKAVS